MTRTLDLTDKFDWIGPLIGVSALAILIAAPALADEDGTHVITIDQVQLDNVLTNLDVEIEDFAKQASVSATAVANTAAGLVTSGDVDFEARQTQDGIVSSIGILEGGSTRQAVATTTAYGNSATAGTWSGNLNYITEQTTNGKIEAGTIVDLDETRKIAAATTGIANVSVPANEYGESYASQTQVSNGSVETTMDVDIDRVRRAATIANTAGGNSISGSGSTSTNISTGELTSAAGETIEATTDIYIRDARNVLGTTTAFGNSATVHNEWGYATLGQQGDELYQENGSHIDAQTYVTLDNWSGTATSNAYGVGNAATSSNVGSDTGLNAIQNNYVSVYSSASFSGSSNHGDGIVTTTSIGNAATATLCNVCGDAALHGTTQQHNAGAIVANGTATVGHAGSIHGAATAVGNAATYQSNGH